MYIILRFWFWEAQDYRPLESLAKSFEWENVTNKYGMPAVLDTSQRYCQSWPAAEPLYVSLWCLPTWSKKAIRPDAINNFRLFDSIIPQCVCVCQSGISPTYTTYRSLLSDASETLAGWALFGPDALDSIKLDRSGEDWLLRWYSFSPGDPKLHVPVWMSVFLPLIGS